MILVLEERPDVQLQYVEALDGLFEGCLVASDITQLEAVLSGQTRVDLVIAEPVIEVAKDLHMSLQRLVVKLRPGAAFLSVTHEPSPPGSFAMLSTASPDFPRQLKLAVNGALTNRLVRALLETVGDRVLNPAQAILGNADNILEMYGDQLPEAVVKSLMVIKGQAIRVGEVTRKLMGMRPQDMEIVNRGGIPMISFEDPPLPEE